MDTYMRIFQALDDMQLGDGTNELLWDYLAVL